MREQKMMIRVNDDELASFEAMASLDGLPTSSWARMALVRAARGEALKAQEASLPHERRLLSLFCGGGGLDEGFQQAGFNTEVAIDKDVDCVNTFRWNHRNALAFQQSVVGLTAERLDELCGKQICPIGVIGGPPCQSFSVSNVHQSDDDPRHRLAESYAALLKQLNARNPVSFFLFENVPGLLGKKHIARYEKFKALFTKAGFEIFETVLDAQNFGVPQIRERLFIVGINRKIHPNVVWSWPSPENRTITVRDVIEGLPDPVYNDRGLDPETFPVHPNHWSLVPKSKKFSTRGMLEEGQAWGRSFRTLAWDEPSWTVAYGHREVHVHPNGQRRVSMYEAMMFQTFPKHYRLIGNISAQARIVSEAVPPRLGWHLACQIRRLLGL